MKRTHVVLLVVQVGCLLAVLSSATARAFGETLYLKDGRKIEARIIERSEKSVVVDWHGVHLTYWLDDIDHIEEGQSSGASPMVGATETTSSGTNTSHTNSSLQQKNNQQQKLDYLKQIRAIDADLATEQEHLTRLLLEAMKSGDQATTHQIYSRFKENLQRGKARYLALTVPLGCQRLQSLMLNDVQLLEKIWEAPLERENTQQGETTLQITQNRAEIVKEMMAVTKSTGNPGTRDLHR